MRLKRGRKQRQQQTCRSLTTQAPSPMHYTAASPLPRRARMMAAESPMRALCSESFGPSFGEQADDESRREKDDERGGPLLTLHRCRSARPERCLSHLRRVHHYSILVAAVRRCFAAPSYERCCFITTAADNTHTHSLSLICRAPSTDMSGRKVKGSCACALCAAADYPYSDIGF